MAPTLYQQIRRNRAESSTAYPARENHLPGRRRVYRPDSSLWIVVWKMPGRQLHSAAGTGSAQPVENAMASGFGLPGSGWMTLGNGAAGKTLPTEAVRCIVGEFRMPRWKFRFNLKEEYP